MRREQNLVVLVAWALHRCRNGLAADPSGLSGSYMPMAITFRLATKVACPINAEVRRQSCRHTDAPWTPVRFPAVQVR